MIALWISYRISEKVPNAFTDKRSDELIKYRTLVKKDGVLFFAFLLLKNFVKVLKSTALADSSRLFQTVLDESSDGISLAE